MVAPGWSPIAFVGGLVEYRRSSALTSLYYDIFFDDLPIYSCTNSAVMSNACLLIGELGIESKQHIKE